MYIYAFSNYTQKVKDTLSIKKPLLKKKFNRTDNFIDLALLGAQQCVKDIPLAKQSSIYLASRNGNLNTTLKVLDTIFLQNKLPMPFQFLNTVNAAKLFYLAKSFSVEGKTLFVDRFESALPQAFVDVQKGKTVLLGIVSEVIEDLNLHEKRFGLKEKEEESRWILLSSQLKGFNPIAKISNLKFHADKENEVSKLFDYLEQEENKEIFYFKGKNLSFELKKIKGAE